MASTEPTKDAPEVLPPTQPIKDAPEVPPPSGTPVKAEPEAPPTQVKAGQEAPPIHPPPSRPFNLFKADLVLRLALFATTVASLVLMVISKQTRNFSSPFSPFMLTLDAKFVYSPALIYFVAAISTACLYSIISSVVSAYGVFRPSPANKLVFHLATLDAVMVGLVASATGAVAAVAYIGLKGNSHVGWLKVCNMYGKFCTYVGSSAAISLASAIILIFLVIISTYSLHRRSTHH